MTEKEKAKTGREIYWEIQESKGFNVADTLLDKEYFSAKIVEKIIEAHQKELGHCHFLNYQYIERKKDLERQLLNYQYIERKKVEQARQLLNSIVWLDKEDVKTKVEQLRNTLGEGKTESKNEGEKEH